jgi:hypothetical protein
MRIGSYVGFGVGAVGIVLGTVFVMKSSSKRKSANEATHDLELVGSTTGGPCSVAGGTCRGDVPQARKVTDLDDQARSAKTVGIVGYVVGGLGVATGVTLFVLSSKKEESKSAFVAPYVGLGAMGVRGAF